MLTIVWSQESASLCVFGLVAAATASKAHSKRRNMCTGKAGAGRGSARPEGHHHWRGTVQDDLCPPGGEGGAALQASSAYGAPDSAEALPPYGRLRGPKRRTHHALHPCLLPPGQSSCDHQANICWTACRAVVDRQVLRQPIAGPGLVP